MELSTGILLLHSMIKRIGQTLTTTGLEAAVNSNPLDSWGNRRVTIGIMGEDISLYEID